MEDNNTEVGFRFQILVQQRNQAMDQVVILGGQLETTKAALEELKKKLEEYSNHDL